MLVASIPAKFSIPWANSAGGSYINAIPTNSQIGIIAGAASLTDGFPPTTMQPGGTPPAGPDFNGILKWITQWQRWQQAGATIIYDAAFSAAIGGYPQNAILASGSTAGIFWVSTVDNNTTNPDAGGAGWALMGVYQNSLSGNGYYILPGFAPNRLCIQWGQVTTTNGAASVVFPISFATVYQVVATDDGAVSWSSSNATFCGVQTATTTGFTARSVNWNGTTITTTGSTALQSWISIGRV